MKVKQRSVASMMSLAACIVAAVAVVVCLLVSGTVSATATNDAHKDRFRYPISDTAADNAASWAMFDRIVIVPDLHGDNKKFQDVLVGTQCAKWEDVTLDSIAANSVNSNDDGDGSSSSAAAQNSTAQRRELRWIAERTLLVQLGDMLDRGPDDKAVMDTMMAMQEQAPLRGSRAVAILGNHEVLQIQSLYHYAHGESAAAFGGSSQRREALAPDGRYGRWLRGLPAIVEAWDTVFVHAGLTRRVAELGVAEVNRLVARDIDINHRKDQPFIFEEEGPVWTRLMVTRAKKGSCGLVDECLQLVGRKRIVVGHTPMRSGPRLMCDDKILAADVGLSRWMYGGTSIVEMVRNATADGSASSGDDVIFNELVPEEELQRQKEKEEAQQQQAASASNNGAAVDLQNELKNDPTALDEIMQVIHEETKQARAEQEKKKKKSSAKNADL